MAKAKWEILLRLPDELERKILLRLPVKSLMRFKVVSKLWRSFILDPSFAAEYRAGFRGLLLTQPRLNRFSLTNDFFYISIDGGQISHHLTVDHGGDRSLACSGIVNGLVCFYSGDYSCLYNLSTRESMELPRSEYAHNSASYHLGFDPVSKLYKVVKICPVYQVDERYDPDYLQNSIWLRNLDYSEILTVGVDACWRRIDPPPTEIVRHAVCIDGALYWDEEMTEDMNDPFVAFHLALEKFEFVAPLPERFNYLPYYAPRLYAVVGCIMRGDAAAGIPSCKGVIIRSHGGSGWRLEHKLSLPREYDDLGQEFNGVVILPDGKVVFFEVDEYFYLPFPFYLFDPVEKKFTRIVMQSCCSPDSHSKKLFEEGIAGRLSYHEENIFPLNFLGTGNRVQDLE